MKYLIRTLLKMNHEPECCECFQKLVLHPKSVFSTLFCCGRNNKDKKVAVKCTTKGCTRYMCPEDAQYAFDTPNVKICPTCAWQVNPCTNWCAV